MSKDKEAPFSLVFSEGMDYPGRGTIFVLSTFLTDGPGPSDSDLSEAVTFLMEELQCGWDHKTLVRESGKHAALLLHQSVKKFQESIEKEIRAAEWLD